MADRFALNFPAEERAASRAMTETLQKLGVLGLPAHRAGDVQIALAEAVNNILEHAYGGSRCGMVEIEARLTPACLTLILRDSGRALPGGTLPAAKLPDLTVDARDLPEGGFGWFLIAELTSHIHYQRRDGRNQLTLGFDIHDEGC